MPFLSLKDAFPKNFLRLMHVYKSFSKCCFDKLYTNNKVDNNLGRFFSNIYSLIFIEFDNFKLYSETIYAKTSEHKNVS
jgi:hypothetical protein